ncbi:MAG: S8 family serine peptidase, partial [Nanoarchaeota archaeon]|nr:S8 family serine peptidase [Nanoarchaeota archaeon]
MGVQVRSLLAAMLVLILLSTAIASKDVIIKFREQVKGNDLPALEVQAQAKQAKGLAKIEGSGFELKGRYSLINAVHATVSDERYEQLKNDPNVEYIGENIRARIFLPQSAPQINANAITSIIINSSINGTGETACIIDTGIDYSHPALGAGWGNKVIAGNKYLDGGTTNISCSVTPSACMDDNGHGTHVAGIIASTNATYKGVAPGANLIAIKVMDSLGSGYQTDIEDGIEWCIVNAAAYNISVISMSLGSEDSVNFSSYCDSSFSTTSALVNLAVNNNISVVVASGNSGYKTNLSWPACLQNVTSVGSISKLNVSSDFSNSGSILDVMAPGENIFSTMVQSPGGEMVAACGTGQYICSLDGTSMAAPHVSGALLLMRNFKRNENGSVLSPAAAEALLKSSGVGTLDPGNGLTKPRINLATALLTLDDTPRVTFNSGNLSQNTSSSAAYISVNSTEPVTATVTLDTATVYNMTRSGITKTYYYNITGLSDGLHNYSVNLSDTTGKKVTSSVYILDVDTVKPDISGVSNVSVNGTAVQILFTASEAGNATVHYGTTQSYGTAAYNSSQITNHNITLTGLQVDTTYYYYIAVSDMAGNTNTTSQYSFRTVYQDVAPPYYSSITASVANNSAYSGSPVQFRTTWQDAINVSIVNIEHNFSGTMENYSVTENISSVFYYNYTLAAGSYVWRMHAWDSSG